MTTETTLLFLVLSIMAIVIVVAVTAESCVTTHKKTLQRNNNSTTNKQIHTRNYLNTFNANGNFSATFLQVHNGETKAKERWSICWLQMLILFADAK